jgi:hypothetical protein
VNAIPQYTGIIPAVETVSLNSARVKQLLKTEQHITKEYILFENVINL